MNYSVFILIVVYRITLINVNEIVVKYMSLKSRLVKERKCISTE